MARGFFAENRRKGDWGDTERARTDTYGQSMYYRDEDFVVADRVQQLAKRRGVSGPRIALAWVLGKPYVTSPIIGATRMQHLDEAVAALDIRLTPEEVQELEEHYHQHAILGHS